MYRKNSFNCLCKAARFCLMLVLFGAVGAVYSQGTQSLASIKEIELKASSRGIVLIISGSGPISVGGNPNELEKMTNRYSELRVNIKNSRSDLGVRSFNVPQELPVREISLKESSGGVDLSVKMRGVANGPVQVRSGDNQIRVLLTRNAYPQLSWAASTGSLTVETSASVAAEPAVSAVSSESAKLAVPVQQAAAVQNKPAESVSALPAAKTAEKIMEVSVPYGKPLTLGNIRVLRRDRTVSLNFDFSDELVLPVSVNRAGDSLVIRFPNAVSKLGSRLYTLPGNTVYGSVRIRQERNANKTSDVVATVKLIRRNVSVFPVGSSFGKQYSLYSAGAEFDAAGVFIWSAVEGVRSNVPFVQIAAKPVDMQKMESRAAGDIKKSGGASFTVTQTPAQAQTAAPEAKQAPLPAVNSKAAPAANLPEQSVKVAPPKAEVPQPSFENQFGDSIPVSDVLKESPDGDTVAYRVYGRDPFIPLMRNPNIDTGLPKVENLRLVGILEDSRERIALLEDFTNANRAFALRAGDLVEYGKVLHIYRDRVVFQMTDFGVSRAHTLRIARNAQ